MSDKSAIKYGDYRFAGQPTPFLTRSEEFIKQGESWGTREIFNLRGQLTGCDFEGVRRGQKDLISGFGQDFQDLAIYDTRTVTFSGTTVIQDGAIVTDDAALFFKPKLKVESISFPQNKYTKLLDYEIQLSHYPTGYFKTYYGVINPVDSWDFNESEDGLLNITHNISCKGFNTDSYANNAFENARNFVNSRTGDQNMVDPHFICKNTYPNFYPCLDTFSESIDRVRGEYSIIENYISDLEGTGYGVTRYTIDLNSGVDSFSTATIQGSVEGCKNKDFNAVRDKYKSLDIPSIVFQNYDNAFGVVDLNPMALTSGIEEDQFNKKLNFNVSFNNDSTSNVFTDITTNITSGDSIINVAIDGRIRGRGNIFDRYENISGKFDTIDIFGLANSAYVDYLDGNITYPLNPKSESSGVMRDQFTPQISFNANFNNRDIPPSGFDSFERNISIVPSLRKVVPIPLFDQDGTYDIVDLKFSRRARLNVSLNGVAEPNQVAETLMNTMKSEANLLAQKYGTLNSLKLDNYQVGTGNQQNYNLSASWSFDTSNNVITGSNYDEISTLKLK